MNFRRLSTKISLPLGFPRTVSGVSALSACYNLALESVENLDEIKHSLTARVSNPISEKTREYPLWFQNSQFLAIPRQLGITVFGRPEKDKTTKGDQIFVKTEITLRPYQECAADRIYEVLMGRRDTIYQADCGTGKTVVAIEMIKRVGVKTAILVHTQSLQNQWVERIEEFMPGVKVGVVQGAREEIEGYDVVVCMMQTLHRGSKPWAKKMKDIGFVIVDEVHHLAAETFFACVPLFKSRYRLGLTATPNRTDGLWNAITWVLGSPCCRVTRDVSTGGLVWKYEYRAPFNPVKKLPWKNTISFPQVVTAISKDDARNNHIVDIIHMVTKIYPERKILVLSDRIDQLRSLQKKIVGVTSGLYIGVTSKKGRLKRRRDAEEVKVLLGSYGCCGEGFDGLQTILIMATPKKDIIQVVGRVRRGTTPPIIIDPVDKASGYLLGMFRKRQAQYRSQRLEVIDNLQEISKRIHQ